MWGGDAAKQQTGTHKHSKKGNIRPKIIFKSVKMERAESYYFSIRRRIRINSHFDLSASEFNGFNSILIHVLTTNYILAFCNRGKNAHTTLLNPKFYHNRMATSPN